MQYRYSGTPTCASLNILGKTQDIALRPNTLVELPEGHPYTQGLIRRGWLTPEISPAAATATEPKTTKGVKNGS